MPPTKKAKISRHARPRKRTRPVTLEESRLSKHEYLKLKKSQKKAVLATSHVVSQQRTACDNETFPMGSVPQIRKRRHPRRSLSTFLHPRRKANRVADDLTSATTGVLEHHGIHDEADLPLIKSAVLRSSHGSTMLAKMLAPADQEPQVIYLPSPVQVDPEDAQASLMKLVKVMDSQSISNKKVNEVRQLFPSIPPDNKIRATRRVLDKEILETLGLYYGTDFAGVDPGKVVRQLLRKNLIPDVRRKVFLISGDGKSTGRKMRSTSLGMQDLTLGKEVAKEKNFYVLFTVRGGEKFEDLNGKLDDLEKQLLALTCPCDIAAPCGDDCPHCLNLDGKLYCIKLIWASDWKFMQLISGAAQASAATNWCHWCSASKADIRAGLNDSTGTDPLRFETTPKERLMPSLWTKPEDIFLDELHWRLRVYGVVLNEIEAKLFHKTDKVTAQARIKDEMVRCGISHFQWYSRMAPGVTLCIIFFFFYNCV